MSPSLNDDSLPPSAPLPPPSASESPSRRGCGSVTRLMAPPPGTGGTPPPPPVEAAAVPLASTWSPGLEDGDGSRRFCAGILAFCP